MNFTQAIKTGFQSALNFSGRASRAEYWYWKLFLLLFMLGLLFLEQLLVYFLPDIGLGQLGVFFAIGTYLPSLSLSIRRLHDINRSGWWLAFFVLMNTLFYSLWLPERVWYYLFPVAGGLATLICWYCRSGDVGDNQYGKGYLPEYSILA